MSNQPSFEATGLALWSVTDEHIAEIDKKKQELDNLIKKLEEFTVAL